jgi:glycosyltransferase involved in cell wall biosynthesis
MTAVEPICLSVIAPCLNEEANVDLLVERTLAAFDALVIGAEIILVDDGSTDRTWERIQDRGRQDPRVRGVRHAVNRGMEAAWRSGLAAARGECVCLIDADLQNRPEDIALLYQAFERGWGDVIQAVRHAVATARQRCMFTRGLNWLLNSAFGMRARDNKSGFILCRREVLADILRHRGRYRYYQSFIGAAAHVRGYRLCEVDTMFDSRHGGQSFLRRPIRASLRILWELAKFRAETWRARRPAAEPEWLAAPGSVQVSAGERR